MTRDGIVICPRNWELRIADEISCCFLGSFFTAKRWMICLILESHSWSPGQGMVPLATGDHQKSPDQVLSGLPSGKHTKSY